MKRKSPSLHVPKTLTVFLLLPIGALAADRTFDVEFDDIFSILKYIFGLAAVILGVFLLTYKDIAAFQFLKRYDHAERTTGQVLSCEQLPGHARRIFQVVILYTAAPPEYYVQTHSSRRAVLGTENASGKEGPLLQQEYIRSLQTNFVTQRGTTVDMFLLPGLPRSGLTKEVLESKREEFSCLGVIMVWIPGAILAGTLLMFAIRDIDEGFPPDNEWVGWALVAGTCFLTTLFSWSFCDTKFQREAEETFLSAFPVHRKDAQGNIVPPPAKPYTNPPVVGPAPNTAAITRTHRATGSNISNTAYPVPTESMDTQSLSQTALAPQPAAVPVSAPPAPTAARSGPRDPDGMRFADV